MDNGLWINELLILLNLNGPLIFGSSKLLRNIISDRFRCLDRIRECWESGRALDEVNLVVRNEKRGDIYRLLKYQNDFKCPKYERFFFFLGGWVWFGFKRVKTSKPIIFLAVGGAKWSKHTKYDDLVCCACAMKWAMSCLWAWVSSTGTVHAVPCLGLLTALHGPFDTSILILHSYLI